MSEIEKAWVKRRTAELQCDGLARAAAQMIAIRELLAQQRRSNTKPGPINNAW